jgi:hypothetical protein
MGLDQLRRSVHLLCYWFCFSRGIFVPALTAVPYQPACVFPATFYLLVPLYSPGGQSAGALASLASTGFFVRLENWRGNLRYSFIAVLAVSRLSLDVFVLSHFTFFVRLS